MLCLLMQSQGGAASSAGHVGIAEAQTFAGENGNQISSNDIHLDSPQSNFVIGPDGKVPSLASQVHSPILILKSSLMFYHVLTCLPHDGIVKYASSKVSSLAPACLT